MPLTELSPDQLATLRQTQRDAYDQLVGRGLKLDLTRGKPSKAQLDLSNELLSLPGPEHLTDAAGADIRNYGGGQGLEEIRSIFAPLIKVPVADLCAGDNSSLALMHDTLAWSVLHGPVGAPRPWSKEEKVTFICPVPGYDRHFALCEELGIEMVPVPLTADGPDLDAVRELVARPDVKGLWAVPTYANPNGVIYSEAVARELVSMPTAAADFRIFWDNAYSVHHLSGAHEAIDVLSLADQAGNPDRVFVFASTSKITFAGAGVSFFGASPANVAWYLKHRGQRTIGPDKVNHLRHALFLRDADGVKALMARHAAIIGPKFEIVLQVLHSRLAEHEIASWTEPEGGYFICLDVLPGTASRVVQLASGAGIAMTPAGAAYPYGNDPDDRNIRIAPTYPDETEVREAMEGLATCVLLASAERAAAEHAGR